MSGCLLTDHLSFIRGHHWALSAVLGRFQRHSQWGRTCGPRTFRGIWSLLHVFGVTVTEAISSKLSSANCLSDIDVVGDSQFLIVEECRLSELRRTEAESNKNSCHSYIHELSKRIQAFFQCKHWLYNQSRRVDAHRAPFGCEMMSCTSSGLFCMTSAAALKVMPSRLMLFREIRRPPAGKGHSGILLVSNKKQMSNDLRWTSELR